MSEDLAPFFELSLELLCIAGVDGRFRRINPAFETLLGFSGDELRSRPFFEFMLPEDREPAMAELDSLRRGNSTIQFENRVVCKDGSIRCLAWTAAPATAEGLIYAAARDITAAKAAEEALRRSEQMMRDFVMTVSHELRTPMTSMRGSLGLLASGIMGELNDEAARAVSVAERNSVRLASVIDDILELEKRP
jgi:PAS domain S-box-containing protein